MADLGCGLGGPVLDLARQRPDGEFTGIESAPLLFAATWLRLRFAGLHNVRLVFGNYRAHGLGDYDVVYAFLSPVPMPDLFDQAKHQMKSGSLFISNTFDVPGHPADETVDVADGRKTRLYLWRF
jgi:SAM-dependent methyltransferase